MGKLDQAAKSYEEALAIETDGPAFAANLARVYVRNGRKDEKTRQLLTDIVMKDPGPLGSLGRRTAWKGWDSR